MRVGVLKEIKTKEHRVSMTPSGLNKCWDMGTKFWLKPAQELEYEPLESLL